MIAQIACHENKLPQGSPCSPVISNIIAHLLDIRLNELASSKGCTYTRYADDLTFSTSEKIFPTSIAKRDPANVHKWLAGTGLMKRVTKAGFTINSQKTRVQYRDSRQEATGLVVNEKVNVKPDYYKLAEVDPGAGTMESPKLRCDRACLCPSNQAASCCCFCACCGYVGNAFALSKRSGISTVLVASILSLPARHAAMGNWLFIA